MKLKRSRSFLSSSLMFVAGTAQNSVSPISQCTFERVSPESPVSLQCLMVGSISLRRLIIACSVQLIPRFCPDRRIRMPSSSAPL
jgi:hypothetical protein